MTITTLVAVFMGCIIGLAVGLLILAKAFRENDKWIDHISARMDLAEDKLHLADYRIQCLQEHAEKGCRCGHEKAN